MPWPLRSAASSAACGRNGMIARLRGTLLEKDPMQVVVDVGGVGLAVEVPLTVSSMLGAVGGPVDLYTHLQVREDDLRLYGFRLKAEREAFETLLGIRGVGGRLALNILSHVDLSALTAAVESGDVQALLAVPGVGRKTAQRLLLELGGRVGRGAAGSDDRFLPWPVKDPRRDAAEALMQLGYPPAQARSAVDGLGPPGDRTADQLIRAALAGVKQEAPD
ncbi:MAG: Holliday junction branch migration protein RuvA [Candidatus Eisenbacteria bacterium]|nr:Holliday junction branch migration protein RuvA [Candidatus Eisenbacteria bacterium]